MRSHQTLLVLVQLCWLLTACGDGAATFLPVGVPTQDDAYDWLSAYDIDRDAGPIPLRLEVALTPTRAPYGIGLEVRPEATVVDVWGASWPVVTDPTAPTPDDAFEVSWTIEPADAVADAGEGRYELLLEGTVVFRGCTALNGVDQVPICGEAIAIVNSGPPMLTVTSPPPGAMLGPADGATITVTGVALDTHGDVRVFVNGEDATLGPDGTFQHTLEPRFGVNHLEISATDGIFPLETRVERDVIWAQDYVPSAATGFANAGAPSAILLRLGQRFFDDGIPVSQDPEQPIVASDLADILELVVENLDLTGQIPDPVVNTSALTLRVLSIDPGLPLAEVEVMDGGVELYLMLPNTTIETGGALVVNGQSLPLTGTINATLSGVIILELKRVDASSPFIAHIASVDLAIEDVTSQFTSPEANAVFAVAESALRGAIESLLVDSLLAPLLDALPAVVLDLFNGLDTALADQSFPLSTGIGPDIQLTFSAGVESLTSHYRDAFLARLGAEVSTDIAPLHPEAPGIAMSTATPTAPFVDARPTQLAVDLQLLNGLTYTLWQSGLLDLDLATTVGPGSFVHGLLPPVFRPARPDEPYDIVLSVGQLEATMSNGAVTFGLFLEAGIKLTLTDGVLALVIADEPWVEVWTIAGSSPILTESTFEKIVVESMWPQLFGAMDQSLAFALPQPDLSGIGALAPALAGMQLHFDLGEPTVMRDGFVLVDVAVSVAVP